MYKPLNIFNQIFNYIKLTIGIIMPVIVEKPTATRSNNLQWSGMCIKTPLDSDVPEDQLEVLLGFNGSNTQGHYVPICKSYPYTCIYTFIFIYHL